jgi:outer membrane receptor protein involved in Fe transport
MLKRQFLTAIAFCFVISVHAQNVVKGIVRDLGNNDPIIGATIIIQGTSEGMVTDWDGSFTLTTDRPFPLTLEVSYTGYAPKVITATGDKQRLDIGLEEDVITIDGIEVKASRISDKQKESPLTIEALDNIAIKETPAADFYDGLGALKGVDLTAASLGFKVVNTRGFNSTSPVRSLQIIDGVDNQAPGLNFSLGNFLGSSELDINKVELVVGASSAFYGPNAFNGVISMETKDPFFHEGLSAMVKVAERNMFKSAIRWADALDNKEGHPFFAYKLNFEYLRADDWVAENYDPVDGSDIPANNPGGIDAVNIYGDEYQRGNDFSSLPLNDAVGLLGEWHRTGYEEKDLVDYDTRNYKANVALHFRLNPAAREQSPEVIVSTNYGSGTTVYQGDNRFSLKGITFLQNRIELRKKNKFFLRAYTTRTTAGDSYDPYFTALQLQENSKENREWSIDYAAYWQAEVVPQIQDSDYPKLTVSIGPNGEIIDNNAQLTQWHNESAAFANAGAQTPSSSALPFFEPGTEGFKQEFDKITGTLRGQGGTKFYDKSALYHVHGEYIFQPTWLDKITVGSNVRLYTPESKGTVFSDTVGINGTNDITNFEFGIYTGLEQALFNNRVKLQGAMRADKNENFDWLLSPAASVVYTPSANNFFRASFSSAIRNPTLADQYLYLDVGRAILSGNLDGVNNLVTVESLRDFFSTQNPALLDSFNIDGVKPEKVKTYELGFRTTLFEKLFLDAGYYFSQYRDFLGFKIGVDLEYDIESGPLTIQKVQPYRYAANSDNKVTTQGLSLGFNYYFDKNFSLQGNYSWNKLNKTFDDDPIIPAFNTPEHKYNIGFGGRNLNLPFGKRSKNFGFNVNYKWIKGFLFEGSPQFTGFIPSYDMLDAQMNYTFTKLDTTLKIGASNLLNNKSFQTYGGPRIGRLAYISLTYEPKK